jgi:hypothetical protein
MKLPQVVAESPLPTDAPVFSARIPERATR